jgi:membrane-associated phospholipid phosphatase
MDPEGRPPRTTSVPAGGRTHRLARLIGLVLAAFVLVEGLLLGLGLLVTRVLDDSSLPRQEIEFEQTIVTERTPLFDQVTRYGSAVGATVTVIVLTAVGCLLLAWRGRGPRLPVFLAVAVAGETGLFLLASLVVKRQRPPVPQLDIAPPTSSFPSGHTAAIIALTCGIALALARTRTGHRLVALTWFLAVLLPAVVLASRLYRGMHWPTDVAASVVFALVWMVLLRAILLPRDVPDRRTSGPPGSS